MALAARFLIVLAVAAAAALPASAQDEEAMLLIAHPAFRDLDYRQAVLLAEPGPNGGHVGVILNRPPGLGRRRRPTSGKAPCPTWPQPCTSAQ